MKIMTDKELIEQIDAFLTATDMAPSRFGLEAMGDGDLVRQLRAGRSLSLKNASRVVDFMNKFLQSPALHPGAAPGGIPDTPGATHHQSPGSAPSETPGVFPPVAPGVPASIDDGGSHS